VSGAGLWGPQKARRPAVPLFKSPRVFGGEGVLGAVVVRRSAGFRGRLSPNGPPSRRLAPGGFYSVRAEYGFVRGEPVPIEPA